MTRRAINITKDLQYYKFCSYGFFKNLRLFEPFLILFFLSNDLTYLQIGFIYTVREVTRNILEIPAGIISDSIGRRRTMITSFGFYISSFILFYFSSTYFFFLLAMVIYALGDAFRTGTHKAMIFDYLKIKGWSNLKAYYYGHTRSFSQLGSAVSSLIGGFMVFYSGNYRDIFIYTSVPYILDLILISTYPVALDGMRSQFSQQRVFDNFKQVFKGFVLSFTKVTTLLKVSNLSLHTGFFQAIKDYLQPILQTLAISLPVLLMYEDKQRTAVIVGTVYFFIYLLTSVSARQSGFVSNFFGGLNKALNVTLALGLVSGFLVGFFYSNNLVILAVAFFILIYILENLRKPIGVANIAGISSQDYLATILSAESQLHSFFTALFAPAIGLLADYLGLGEAILILSAALLLISPLVYLRKARTG